MGTQPATAAVGTLDSLGAVVECTKLGVMDADRTNLRLGSFGGGGSDRSRSGDLDDRAEFLLLRSDHRLEVKVSLDGVGFAGELPQFDGLILRTLGHGGQFGHSRGDGRGTILKSLEIRCHLASAPS